MADPAELISDVSMTVSNYLGYAAGGPLAGEDSDNNKYVLAYDGSGDVALFKNVPGEATWTAMKTWTDVVAPSTGQPFGLNVDSSDNIHVVYVDASNIQYSKSADGGTAWSPDSEDSGLGSNTTRIRSVGVGSAGVFVVVGSQHHDFTAIYRRDTGGSWSTLSNPSTTNMEWPKGHQVPGNANLYTSGTETSGVRYFVINCDTAAVDAAITTVNFSGTESGQSQILEDGNGDLHAVWQNKQGVYFQNFMYSNNIGGWGAEHQLYVGVASKHGSESITLTSAGEVIVFHSALYYNAIVSDSFKSTVARLGADHTDWDAGSSVGLLDADYKSIGHAPPYTRSSAGGWAMIPGVVNANADYRYWQTSDYALPVAAVVGVPPWVTSPQVIGVGHV